MVFLAEPPRTAYDLQFWLLGFPVRVTPFFWVVSALLGYNIARALRDVGPGQFAWLVLWVAAVFVSILVHELGHALAMRRYGWNAAVVLYHFGGLAIPTSEYSFGRSRHHRRSENQIAISLAGPGAQLALAGVILIGLRAAGYQSLADEVWPIDVVFPSHAERPIPSATLDILLYFLVVPSVAWALLNLLPVFPLDGGQVSRELFTMFGGSDGIRTSLYLSLGVAVATALYFFSTQEGYSAMLFVSLAVSNYQLLQMMRFGGGRW